MHHRRPTRQNRWEFALGHIGSDCDKSAISVSSVYCHQVVVSSGKQRVQQGTLAKSWAKVSGKWPPERSTQDKHANISTDSLTLFVVRLLFFGAICSETVLGSLWDDHCPHKRVNLTQGKQIVADRFPGKENIVSNIVLCLCSTEQKSPFVLSMYVW